MNKKEKPAARRPTVAAARARAAEPTLNDIPRWLPALVYALVTVVLFREFIIGSGGLLGVDTMALSYFARNFYTEFVHTFHTFPLWNPLLYGGMPFIDGMHGDIFYPPSLALFFLNAQEMWGWKMALHIFAAGVFTYLWLREINVSRGSALLGGLIFMLGADLVSLTYPGGDGKLFVSALAPLAFLLTERAVRLQRARDYAAFALGVTLMILTSHMQLAYFAIWGITFYFIFRCIQQWRRGEWTGGRLSANFGAFALAGLLGAGAAAIQILPPLDYLREWSHRATKTVDAAQQTGFEYSTTYALHPEEIMSLVVPEFIGDNVQTETHPGTTYWGRNGFKINHEYAGLLGLLLLPLLFLRRRNGQTWFFVGLSVFALLYALGANTPFFKLFYMVPGVSLFRAPSLIIFLYGLSIATLAALAFDRATEFGRGTEGEDSSARKGLWLTVGVLGVLALLAQSGVLTSLWQSIIFPGIKENQVAALQTNMANIKTGFWITFLIGVLVVAAWEGFARGMWSARTALIAVCAIVFLDQLRVNAPFVRATTLMNEAADPALFTSDESIDFLKQRQEAGEVFRAFDLGALTGTQGGYPDNALAIHGIEQLAGHHGNEIGRYRELLGGDRPYNLNNGLSLLDLTNTMYVLSPQPMNLAGYTEAFRGSRSIVYRKADVLPRAYLVGAVEVVRDADAVQRMQAPDFDFRRIALVSAPLAAGVTIQPDPQGSVQWLERAANSQRLKVRTDRPALLMVLDNYYKSWHVHVGDNDAEMLRANHTFRAVPIPAGEHEVSFEYNAGGLHTPAMISAAVMLLLMAVAFGGPLLERIRRKPVTA